MRLWKKCLYRTALCVLVLLLCIGAAPAMARQGEMDTLEQQAYQAYIDEFDEDAAIALCVQAVQQDPKAAWAYALHAEILMNTEYDDTVFQAACDVLEQGFAQGAQSEEMHRRYAYALYEMGELENALAAIERAIVLDDTQAACYRLQSLILEDLGRFEEAEAAYETSEALDYEELYGTPQTVRESKDEMAGIMDAFADPRWAGYAPVASAYYDEIPDPSEIFVIMRKDGHNVLCMLRLSREQHGYVLAWENDKAVYQGDRTPEMYYDGHLDGMLQYEYIDEDGPSMSRHVIDGFEMLYSETYMFLCDEEDGEWRFERMSRNHLDPEDGEYSAIAALTMEADGNGSLSMLWRLYERNGSYLDETDPLTDMPFDPDAYVPEVFDITRCNADFDALWREADQ